MKTLLVALEYPPAVGGVETYYSELVRNWPEEIRVLDNSERKLVNGWRWLPALGSVAAQLRSYKPDWLIVGEILPLGTVAWILAHFFNFKYAVILHGLDFSLATRNPFKRFLTGRILARASKIIAVNSYTAELIEKQYPGSKDKTAVVNPGARTFDIPELLPAKLRANYGLEGTFVLLTMARLVKRKGVDMVLRSLPALLKRIPSLRYVIIGNGPDRAYMQALIDEFGLDEHVIFLPTVSEAEKAAWLSIADVFAMPARNIGGDYEGFGIVYLDAGFAGKPVIAGRSGGVRDAVSDGINGLVVDEEDPHSIALAIERLFDDPELRQRLGEKGHERAAAQSWNLQIKKIYDFLK